jgi:hypothetical protein
MWFSEGDFTGPALGNDPTKFLWWKQMVPKLSDLKPVMAEAGGRPPATARHKRAGKARPYLNSPTCSVGAGFIPARGESTFAVASV